MAKKQVKVTKVSDMIPGIEKIFSEKYQCLITKADAFYDEGQKSWLNQKIEESLKQNPHYKGFSA
jgi:hypothetical protein